MSSDVSWHIRDKLWASAEARFSNSWRPRKPEGSLGRTAQDVHLDSHTAPAALWRRQTSFWTVHCLHRTIICGHFIDLYRTRQQTYTTISSEVQIPLGCVVVPENSPVTVYITALQLCFYSVNPINTLRFSLPQESRRYFAQPPCREFSLKGRSNSRQQILLTISPSSPCQ